MAFLFHLLFNQPTPSMFGVYDSHHLMFGIILLFSAQCIPNFYRPYATYM